MILASIDVGTNTVRLLVAEVVDGKIVRELVNLREITRLGENLRSGGGLSAAARARTLDAVRRFADAAKKAGAQRVSAIATAALRRASDSKAFIDDVRSDAGIELEVISGEEEARRTLIGIHAGVGERDYQGPKLLVDIGGGSTEFVLTEDWEAHRAMSISIGAVSLHERFIINDPPSDLELSDLQLFCRTALEPLARFLPEGGPPLLIGTAGTITTLAAIDLAMDEYDPERVTGHRMSKEEIDRLLARFVGLSKENRKLIAGVEPGREDIILTGTMLLSVVMARTGANNIIVCDFGLREGNLLDFYGKTAL